MITKKSLQNLNGLLMLSAIAKYQSKRKAAEATNSSIDTVNKYISNLEQVLGVKLVVNNAKGSHLTSRARLIVEQVENVQDMLDKIYSQHRPENKYEGNVCVCLPQVISAALFPSGVASFGNEYPDIKVISFSTPGSPDYREMGIDFGILTSPPEASREFSLLYEKSVKCDFFSSRTYLEKYGCPESLTDLLKNHRIVNGLQYENYIPGWKELMQQAQHIVFSSNSAFAVAEAIKHDLGIGLMPSRFTCGNIHRLDRLADGLDITVYLIANNFTKDIPRVKIVTDYYKAALDRI